MGIIQKIVRALNEAKSNGRNHAPLLLPPTPPTTVVVLPHRDWNVPITSGHLPGCQCHRCFEKREARRIQLGL